MIIMKVSGSHLLPNQSLNCFSRHQMRQQKRKPRWKSHPSPLHIILMAKLHPPVSVASVRSMALDSLSAHWDKFKKRTHSLSAHRDKGTKRTDSMSVHWDKGRQRTDCMPAHWDKDRKKTDPLPAHWDEGRKRTDSMSAHWDKGRKRTYYLSAHWDKGTKRTHSLSAHWDKGTKKTDPLSAHWDKGRKRTDALPETSILVWQHVKLSEQIRPWDTLTCCWDVKQPPNNNNSFARMQKEDRSFAGSLR